MRAASRRGRHRIAVRLPEQASVRQQRELGAFARYCILRIERELGERDAWLVRIAPISATAYESRITVTQAGAEVQASGSGNDGALATWDAMCRLEEALRERRGT